MWSAIPLSGRVYCTFPTFSSSFLIVKSLWVKYFFKPIHTVYTARPCGILFLCRKSLDNRERHIEASDARLLRLDINSGGSTPRVINWYLPYDNRHNDGEYAHYLAKIHKLLNDHPNNNAMVIGDYRAHPHSRFGGELSGVCNDFNYAFDDTD